MDRRRSAFTHPGLKAIVAATGCRQSLVPTAKRSKNGTFWTPAGCFPRAIRTSTGATVPLACPLFARRPQNSAICGQLFSQAVPSGENSRNRTDRMPSRAIGKRAGATVYAAHRPSRKYATFKLGSNVAPICFRARTDKCAGADDLPESGSPWKRPPATVAQHVVMRHKATFPIINQAGVARGRVDRCPEDTSRKCHVQHLAEAPLKAGNQGSPQ